jgi:thioredoxin-related protein
MKTLLVLLLPAILSFAIAVEPLAIGAPIPKADKKLDDVSGKQVSLKEAFKSNGLLVMFSCNTCPVVVGNQERTNDISKYALTKNVGVVLLNSNEANRADEESIDAMKEYANRQGYKWYYCVDKNNELADAFGANRTPECFLFDKDGKLVYHGAIDDNPQNADDVKRKHLQEAINELATGKEISVKKSRSIGCSIKRA